MIYFSDKSLQHAEGSTQYNQYILLGECRAFIYLKVCLHPLAEVGLLSEEFLFSRYYRPLPTFGHCASVPLLSSATQKLYPTPDHVSQPSYVSWIAPPNVSTAGSYHPHHGWAEQKLQNVCLDWMQIAEYKFNLLACDLWLSSARRRIRFPGMCWWLLLRAANKQPSPADLWLTALLSHLTH